LPKNTCKNGVFSFNPRNVNDWKRGVFVCKKQTQMQTQKEGTYSHCPKNEQNFSRSPR